MGIQYFDHEQTFHIQGRHFSYLMKIFQGKTLLHLYFGKKIRSIELDHLIPYRDRAFGLNPDPEDRRLAFDCLPMEYPCYGHLDFRHPALHLQYGNGATVTDLIYKSHRIVAGKEPLGGLPAAYVESKDEAETLEIILNDPLTGLEVLLSYTVYHDRDILCRSARLVNRGLEAMTVRSAQSMSLDFPDCRFEMLQLSGAWARERMPVQRRLAPGIQSVGSRRGASSHQHNPFIALLRPETTETFGEVFGFSLVYSGNFLAEVEVSEHNAARVTMGIDPFNFSWLLEPGETFQTPEVMMAYSSEGLGELSRTYHALFRERLSRGKWRDRERPILVNNWEATYFDFDEAKIMEIAGIARELGMELFVLDDGWFGKRNDDRSSLGDWVVNREKLRGGLSGLAEGVEKLGMRFGIWVEPEMVSPDSDLYRQHPDWCLHVSGRESIQTRSQLVLDLSRPPVCEAVYAMIADILKRAPIAYVKWDMNRNMSDIGSPGLPPERQRETGHRYMLGLYRILERLTAEFPDVLFESCSGGGGRFDPGLLYYMPQTWTSDDTDAIERLRIQYGTSILYPPIAMGAHVSAVPNHQLGRVTPLITRGHAAMSGNFGYELDLTQMDGTARATIREQVDTYRSIRRLVQFGEFYRLLSPFQEDRAAWMFRAKDGSTAVVFYFNILAQPNAPDFFLKLNALDPTADYRIEGYERLFGGDELMNIGIPVGELQDFSSIMMRIERV